MTALLERPGDVAATPQEQHERALQQSLEQEQLGYLPDVEITRDVVMPRIISQETMAALAIRRKIHNRQLIPHPDDESKMVITGLRNRIY